jgi:hypothetical protein
MLPGLLLGLVLGALATWLLRPGRAGSAPPGPTRPTPAAADRSVPGVHLTAEQRAAAGLVIAPAHFESLPAVVQAFGRVLDPTSLIAAAADVVTAEATATAAEKELARVRALHDGGNNASLQAVEAAEAAARRERVQQGAAQARFAAAWGSVLSARLDAAGLLQTVASGSALARLELPAGEAAPAAAGGSVRVRRVSDPAGGVAAEILGEAATVDPLVQGRGYVVLLPPASFPVGATVQALLPTGGPALQQPVLPRSAFVRHEGSVFVYVQTAPEQFERRRVETGRTLPEGVAVASGLDDHAAVVLTGAQQLLSMELGAAGAGD